MKKIYQKLSFLLVLLVALSAGCKKDVAQEQEAANPLQPRIFDILRQFSGAQVISEGDTAKFTGVEITPADKAVVSWQVNNVEVSKDKKFVFAPKAGGEFTIKLKVTYNGDSTVRSTKVLVNPTTYTFKPYTQIAMSYLTGDATAANVNFNNVTHIAYKVGLVSPEGDLDVSSGEVNQKANELVARAHIAGVPVIMGISGRLSGIDGWAIYETNDFGTAIRDAAKRAKVIAAVKAYVAAKRMDGVDILMTDINSGNAPDNIHAIGPFLTELKAALPANAIVTVTATVNYQHWEYPDLSAASWVNIHAYEDNGHIGPDAPVDQSSSYDFMVSSANIWTNFHLPASKIVVGMPAFGLRYNELNAAGNNASWGSYDYVTYKAIIAADPGAFANEVTNKLGVKTYYNGVPLISKKSLYVKASGFKGAYLWGGDYDTADANSLMLALFNGQK
ncbi:glycoside hydrolase family 18 protein [Mucilaginibacter sp. ZT4R22]|uniref:chitinase n=1 Tax=Mucilaginibacter pankratovii TaxID=2772110 RepID=A0ABR7WM26_9SPHI|nr:glycoside hydrolase family 18 protein [Mucilaginibacter pankratovii]MBD1363201.1 glycoside hydrolase family 18 protein [Mucilaginibacter pankratovii]